MQKQVDIFASDRNILSDRKLLEIPGIFVFGFVEIVYQRYNNLIPMLVLILGRTRRNSLSASF